MEKGNIETTYEGLFKRPWYWVTYEKDQNSNSSYGFKSLELARIFAELVKD